MSTAIDFSCRVCGAMCDSAPDLPARAICEKCCEDGDDGHNYVYDRARRSKFCRHCDARIPDDYYLED